MSMYDRRGWTRISCEERNEHYEIAGDDLRPISSLTDYAGEFGEPVVFTEWGRNDSDEPLLRDFLYPGPESDVKPCEHWFFTGEA